MASTHITQRTISTIAATGAVQFIRDNDPRGFAIKVTANGKATYVVEKRIKGGSTVRKAIGDVDLLPLDDARLEAKKVLLDLSRGIDIRKVVAPAEIEPECLNEALEGYLRVRKSKLAESTQQSYRKVIANQFGDWLPKSIEKITDRMVLERYVELIAKHSKSYCNIGMRTLKAILNGSGVSVNPVSKAMKRGGFGTSSTTKNRFLTGTEIERIMHYQNRDNEYELVTDDDGFSDLIMFYLSTGCRKNEALNLKKADVSSTSLTFRLTKAGRDHTIPMTGWIAGIIERRIASRTTDRLWNFTEHEFRKRLALFAKRMKFKEPWSTHDLRRTFAEHSSLAGVDLNTIAMALNHAPTGVTGRSYLGGGLAQNAALTEAFKLLQRQYLWCYDGMDTESKALPEGWENDVTE